MTAIFTTPVDATVVAYLKPLRAPVLVATKFPTAIPSRMTRVVLAGGGGRRSTVLSDATVAVECVADTYAQAAADMSLVDGYMHDARHAAGSGIRNVESFGAPVELPIPDSPKFRLTATYQVTVRAA